MGGRPPHDSAPYLNFDTCAVRPRRYIVGVTILVDLDAFRKSRRRCGVLDGLALAPLGRRRDGAP